MAPRKANSKRIHPERAGIYWAKAQDFFKMMREAALARNWNGVGLAAVHCAISASDAITASLSSSVGISWSSIGKPSQAGPNSSKQTIGIA